MLVPAFQLAVMPPGGVADRMSPVCQLVIWADMETSVPPPSATVAAAAFSALTGVAKIFDHSAVKSACRELRHR